MRKGLSRGTKTDVRIRTKMATQLKADGDEIALLRDLPVEFLGEFCRLAVSLLLSGGSGGKPYAAAAKQLKVPAERVEAAVAALAQALMVGARRGLSEKAFAGTLEELRLGDERVAAVVEAHAANWRRVRQYLSDSGPQLPHYADVSWRIDVQLASRTLRKRVEPTFLLRLDTEPGGRQQMLQADYASLQHVVEQLEDAARQARTSHAKRVLRYI